MSIVVQDSDTVDLTLSGSGSAADPWVISATIDVSSVSSLWTTWTGTSAEFALETPAAGTLYIVDDS